jgi:hypothetical protein
MARAVAHPTTAAARHAPKAAKRPLILALALPAALALG